MPARASFATGQYVHKVRCWDNAIAYDGQPAELGAPPDGAGPSRRLDREAALRDSDPKRNGFDEEILPLHIVNGVGDLLGLIRDELPRRAGALKLGPEAGPGESEYTRYDREHRRRDLPLARARRRRSTRGKPWVLYVGFVSPHFPADRAAASSTTCIREDEVPWPDMYDPAERPHHPFTDAMRKCMCFDEPFDAPMVRRAIAAYFGLVSFLDDNVGKILRALEDDGPRRRDTRVIYSSDHGDNLGTRGMWGKSTMYEESAGIPMIMAGAGRAARATCATRR